VHANYTFSDFNVAGIHSLTNYTRFWMQKSMTWTRCWKSVVGTGYQPICTSSTNATQHSPGSCCPYSA